MKRILIGSGNPKKVRELSRLLSGLGIAAVTLDDLPGRPTEPEETGETFEDNAATKALAYAAATGLSTLADDSGLEVEALDGRPGVRSARYSGPDATDRSNNERLLAELAGVPAERRGARYVAVLVLARDGEVLLTARGECAGRILEEGRGSGGFGYDPLFQLEGQARTFAELTPDEKAAVSHRGKALEALTEGLRRLEVQS